MVRTALKTSETTFLPLHFRWPCSCFRIELEASCARCTASCTGSCVADLTLVLFWFKAVPLSGQEIFRCLACRSLFKHQILAYLGLPFRLCNLFMNFMNKLNQYIESFMIQFIDPFVLSIGSELCGQLSTQPPRGLCELRSLLSWSSSRVGALVVQCKSKVSKAVFGTWLLSLGPVVRRFLCVELRSSAIRDFHIPNDVLVSTRSHSERVNTSLGCWPPYFSSPDEERYLFNCLHCL